MGGATPQTGTLCVDRKTYTKLSTFEYVIKYACTTNLVTNFKFAEEYYGAVHLVTTNFVQWPIW